MAQHVPRHFITIDDDFSFVPTTRFIARGYVEAGAPVLARTRVLVIMFSGARALMAKAMAVAHEHLVTIDGFCEVSDGMFFLLVKDCHGAAMTTETIRVAQQFLSPIEQAFQIAGWVHQILRTILHLHKQSRFVVDISPQNLFLLDDKITIACRRLHGPDDRVEVADCAFRYTSPMILTGSKSRCDGLVDVHCIRSTIFEIIAKCPPFAGKSEIEALVSSIVCKVPLSFFDICSEAFPMVFVMKLEALFLEDDEPTLLEFIDAFFSDCHKLWNSIPWPSIENFLEQTDSCRTFRDAAYAMKDCPQKLGTRTDLKRFCGMLKEDELRQSHDMVVAFVSHSCLTRPKSSTTLVRLQCTPQKSHACTGLSMQQQAMQAKSTLKLASWRQCYPCSSEFTSHLNVWGKRSHAQHFAL